MVVCWLDEVELSECCRTRYPNNFSLGTSPWPQIIATILYTYGGFRSLVECNLFTRRLK